MLLQSRQRWKNANKWKSASQVDSPVLRYVNMKTQRCCFLLLFLTGSTTNYSQMGLEERHEVVLDTCFPQPILNTCSEISHQVKFLFFPAHFLTTMWPINELYISMKSEYMVLFHSAFTVRILKNSKLKDTIYGNFNDSS